jgi:hypothetical protein
MDEPVCAPGKPGRLPQTPAEWREYFRLCKIDSTSDAIYKAVMLAGAGLLMWLLLGSHGTVCAPWEFC